MVTAIALFALSCTMASGVSAAATDDTVADDGTDEAYPPDEVIIEVDPPPCEATSISGTLTGAGPGSAGTITVSQDGATIASDTFTADDAGNADYGIALPTGTLGALQINASGTTATSNGGTAPFSVDATANIDECPVLPPTGSSTTGTLLTGGAIAAIAGGIIVAATTRRRRTAQS